MGAVQGHPACTAVTSLVTPIAGQWGFLALMDGKISGNGDGRNYKLETNFRTGNAKAICIDGGGKPVVCDSKTYCSVVVPLPTEHPTTAVPTEHPTTKPPSPSPSHTPTEIPTASPTQTPTDAGCSDVWPAANCVMLTRVLGGCKVQTCTTSAKFGAKPGIISPQLRQNDGTNCVELTNMSPEAAQVLVDKNCQKTCGCKKPPKCEDNAMCFMVKPFYGCEAEACKTGGKDGVMFQNKCVPAEPGVVEQAQKKINNNCAKSCNLCGKSMHTATETTLAVKRIDDKLTLHLVDASEDDDEDDLAW